MATTDQLLGQLTEAVNGLRRDVTTLREEKNQYEESASTGRRALHERIDQLGVRSDERFSHLENTATIAGETTKQIRDVIFGLQTEVAKSTVTLRDEVMPVVRTVNMIEGKGKKWLISAAVAGASAATAVLGVIAANWGPIWHWIKATF